MVYLFVGLGCSGILARLHLLMARGGWLHQDNMRKPGAQVLFELAGSLSGIASFILSFFLFSWWIPLAALALGYWIIAPIVVTRDSFVTVYTMSFALALVSLACSVLIIYTYL